MSTTEDDNENSDDNNNNNNNSKLGMRIKNHESINDEELTPPTPFNETKVDVALTSFEERLRKKMARLSQDSTIFSLKN